MKKMQVKLDDSIFKIFSDGKLYGEIIFDKNNLEASLKIGTKIYRAEKGPDKNISLKQDGNILFTFKFDYIWGGAEITSSGIDSGYDVKGRWFKPGTRLTDIDDKDLIIALKKDDGLDVTIVDSTVSPEMILGTIYYHIYSSGAKMLGVLIGSVV